MSDIVFVPKPSCCLVPNSDKEPNPTSVETLSQRGRQVDRSGEWRPYSLITLLLPDPVPLFSPRVAQRFSRLAEKERELFTPGTRRSTPRGGEGRASGGDGSSTGGRGGRGQTCLPGTPTTLDRCTRRSQVFGVSALVAVT